MGSPSAESAHGPRAGCPRCPRSRGARRDRAAARLHLGEDAKLLPAPPDGGSGAGRSSRGDHSANDGAYGGTTRSRIRSVHSRPRDCDGRAGVPSGGARARRRRGRACAEPAGPLMVIVEARPRAFLRAIPSSGITNPACRAPRSAAAGSAGRPASGDACGCRPGS